jgi:hypothetical protein
MAKINWTNSSGGDFAIGTNWSTGTVPGSFRPASIMWWHYLASPLLPFFRTNSNTEH